MGVSVWPVVVLIGGGDVGVSVSQGVELAGGEVGVSVSHGVELPGGEVGVSVT